MGGVARRNWARNKNAVETAKKWNEKNKEKGHITLPFIPKEGLAEGLVRELFEKK